MNFDADISETIPEGAPQRVLQSDRLRRGGYSALALYPIPGAIIVDPRYIGFASGDPIIFTPAPDDSQIEQYFIDNPNEG